jgi:hypothetical protein
MEQTSDQFQQQLSLLMQTWPQEQEEFDVMNLTTGAMEFETEEQVERVSVVELFNSSNYSSESVLDKCKRDLNRPGIFDFQYPEYVE